MTQTLIGTSAGETLEAFGFDDFLILGRGGADTLFGANGDDILQGGGGNDTLHISGGRDYLLGGAGNDTYVIGPISTLAIFRFVEAANEGIDTVQVEIPILLLALEDNIENVDMNAQASFTYGNNLSNVIDATDVTTGGVSIFGEGGADTIFGGTGNDLIDGGTGADVMDGGAGFDTYFVDDVNDFVTDSGSISEYDQVVTRVNFTAGDGIDGLTLEGSAKRGNGNELDNFITGNARNNTLKGFDGDDTLTGGAGKDTMTGGKGDDILYGGRGKDIMRGSAGNDTFVYVSHRDTGTTETSADKIRDLRSGDVIDMRSVDGDATVFDTQSFEWIGNSAFTGTAGELQFTNGYLRGDRDGDGTADFFIAVSGSLANVEDALLL